MVKAESFKFKNGFASNGKVFKRVSGFEIQQLNRGANGRWTTVGVLSVEYQLADGRKVTTTGQVRVTGRQEGIRPNPAAFKAKKRKKSNQP